MTDLLQPGTGLLYMKVGMHAREDLDAIVERKLKEIERAGRATWGYGGSTCHPRTMVQPYAKALQAAGRPIHLVMEPMKSRHDHAPVRASSWSTDNENWEAIPEGIDALGSKFALVIGDLRAESFELPLERTQVPIGPSEGRPGSLYIGHQCDKALLTVTSEAYRANADAKTLRRIEFVAELVEPYAVFLR
ncbi:hypothetical protein SR41_16640 [Sphingomonas melonis]|uniref:Uncharacterized protein n=1 Tax=Sphingomonas melonis TaxID=152682 RepID=A0A0D1ME39_9SPHN|nr:hypothetical protein [Sphingomonas melonis]KIU26006.1 hypothetical protein SR41_16640 [Sphingomonas melonis]